MGLKDRRDIHLYNEATRLEHSQFSAWSTQQSLTVATDPTIPSPPTLAAAAADQAIDLTITAPTTNTDSTTITDILEYNIYYDPTDAIDVTNNATYAGVYTISATRKTHPTSAQHYFKATCVDKWGNESAGSNEVNATPTTIIGPVAVDDYGDNFDSILVGDGMIGIVFNVPKNTWDRWAGWKLYTANDGGGGSGSLPADPTTLIYTGSGGSFIHKGLNESYLYEYKLCILGEDGTITAGTIDDNSGSGYQPNQTDNSVFDGTVIAKDVVATDEVRGDHFYAQSYLHIGVPGWQSDGCQFEYNSGNPRFYVGDGGVTASDKYVMHDGTNLSWRGANTSLSAGGTFTATDAVITGAITASSGVIGGFTIDTTNGLYAGAGATRVQMKAGAGFWAGATAQGSAPFRVTAAGIFTTTNATITGDLETGTSPGARVRITPSFGGFTHSILSYDGSNNLRTRVEAGAIHLLDANESGVFSASSSTNTITITLADAGTRANLYFKGDSSDQILFYEGGIISGFSAKLIELDYVNLDMSTSTVTGTFATGSIPNLSANKITSDSFHVDRIPNLATSKITSGAFHVDRIPNLSASKITSGVFATALMPVTITKAALSMIASTGNITVQSASGNVVLNAGSGDNVILQAAGSSIVSFDSSSNTGNTSNEDGWISVLVGGQPRFIALYKDQP